MMDGLRKNVVLSGQIAAVPLREGIGEKRALKESARAFRRPADAQTGVHNYSTS